MEKISHQDYLDAIKLIEQYKRQLIAEMKAKIVLVDKQLEFVKILPSTSLFDIDCSIRLLNCIHQDTHNEVSRDRVTLEYIYKNYTRSSLLKIKRFGSKSLIELDEILSLAGLSLRD